MSIRIKNQKIGIALSGGGVRAAVFHLGVLKRLADENLIEKIRMLSTVSGGTLLTGLIYNSNKCKWPTSIELKNVCIPHIKECLTKRNLQLNALLRTLFGFLPYIGKGRASIVGGSLRYCWGIKCKLNDIPTEPRWNINATAIESGKSWRFVPNNRMGDYILNYVENPDIKLSEAICSSAAVPFLIGSLKLNTANYKWFRYEKEKRIETTPTFKSLHIWDGGAYDNLGIEPLVKYANGLTYREEINFMLVSDAARAIVTEKRRWYNPIRLIDITMDQVRSLRARALWNHFNINKNVGTYIQCGQSVEHICALSSPPYPNSNVTRVGLSEQRIFELKNYPTTLWRMKEKDFDDLLKHGWEAANASLVSQCPTIFQNQPNPF